MESEKPEKCATDDHDVVETVNASFVLEIRHYLFQQGDCIEHLQSVKAQEEKERS
jgi:hypothetical protein